MRLTLRHMVLCIAGTWLLAIVAVAQDSPSLGDVARKARQQKQQDKSAPDKAGQPQKKSRVINDEDVTHSVTTQSDAPGPANEPGTSSAAAAPSAGKQSPEQWKAQILAQKETVNTLQKNIDTLDKSIQFAPGNCVSGCVQWNERQKQKQGEVERMRAQLQDEQKHLADMQEAARQQGYGSSITDP